MLTQLSISGLAIIDEAHINFSPSFNVITGETGAGKSILIKALGLLLGMKSSPDMIREGKDQATVVGRFDVLPQHPAVAVLLEHGLISEPEGNEHINLLFRRTITAKGKTSAWVNDIPITIGTLKQIGECLLDIFGQHENQKLLNPEQHLSALDAFLVDPKLKDKVRQRVHAMAEGVRELGRLLENQQKKLRDRDYLQFRMQETHDLIISPERYEAALLVCDNAKNSVKLREDLVRAKERLDSYENGALSEQIWEAAHIIESIGDLGTSLQKALEDLKQAAGYLDEATFALEKNLSSLDIDDAAIEESQTLVAQYQRLMRKFGVGQVSELQETLAGFKTELEDIEQFPLKLSETLQDLQSLSLKLRADVETLTTQRKKISQKIEKMVAQEFKDLELPHATLSVDFSPVQRAVADVPQHLMTDTAQELWNEVADVFTSVQETGAEKAQFLFSANQGESPKPLQKIASGGEISRIMLAIKKVLAAEASTCVLVFDEIDAGISGRAANMVGGKMKEMAGLYQILCISHLPQVSVYADRHFRVEKFQKAGRTESRITALTEQQSLEEIARLLSGQEVSEESLANAKRLRQKAMEKSKSEKAQPIKR